MTWQVGVVLGILAAWVLLGAAAVVRAVVRSVGHRRAARRRALEGDPIETLVLQVRLGQMARELRSLADSPGFAAAHHVRAAQAAYDALLAEACRRAGLSVDRDVLRLGERAAEQERLREELELASRGWTW